MAADESQTEDVLFTFRIGHQKRVFQVDKQVIAFASPVLGRMMENGMKETEEKSADLPQVSHITFLDFVQHAQNIWSKHKNKLEKRQRGPIQGYGTIIAKSIDNGLLTFRCRRSGCHKSTALPFCLTFPFCAECGDSKASILNGMTQCILCAKPEKTLYFNYNLCKECLDTCGLQKAGYSCFEEDIIRDELDLSIDDVDDIKVSRFDIPILTTEIMASYQAETSMSPNMTSSAMDMVEQWRFADMYEIRSFGNMAVFRLFELLATVAHSAEDILSLGKYIYEVTLDSGFEVDFEKGNVLRRLIASYIAYHTTDLRPAALGRIMCHGGEIALDVCLVQSMIKAGKVGRGWSRKTED